jgi:hypothetical protein
MLSLWLLCLLRQEGLLFVLCNICMKLTDIGVFMFVCSRTTGRICMEFGMEGVLLRTTQNHTFQFPTFDNNNVADEETCEVGSTVEAQGIGSYIFYSLRLLFIF